MPPISLPCRFDIDRLLKVYFEAKVVKTPRNCKNALLWIKRKKNLEDLNEETLADIDNYIAGLKTQEFSGVEGLTQSTVKSHCGRIVQMLFYLCGYTFTRYNTKRIFRHIQNHTDDNNEIDTKMIPPILLQYSTSDPNVYKLILRIRDYMISRNYSKSHCERILGEIRRTLIPLKDNFLDGTVTRDIIVKHIQDKEDCNEHTKIKSRNPQYENNDASYLVRHLTMAFNIIMASGILGHLVGVKPIQPCEIRVKEKEIERVLRDYFTNEELEKIANCYENDFERLIFTLFLTVGLRVGAVANLRIKNLFGDDRTSVLEIGTASEKGGKTRAFVVFPALKQALVKYRESHVGFFQQMNNFIFPCKMSPSEHAHLCKTTIVKAFKKVCKKADVTGDQVHTHACRKTVVVNLMKDGNTIDNVAKFIGHSNPIVTAQHYWVTTPSELISSMNISWLVGPAVVPGNNTDKGDSRGSSSSGPNLKQIQKIAVSIAEGFKAQERLKHALSTMTEEQVKIFEEMWNVEAKQKVADKTREVMIEIAEAATTLASRSQKDQSEVCEPEPCDDLSDHEDIY